MVEVHEGKPPQAFINDRKADGSRVGAAQIQVNQDRRLASEQVLSMHASAIEEGSPRDRVVRKV